MAIFTKKKTMGRVDIEEQAEILAEQVYWDEDKYSYDEFMAILKQVIEDVASYNYKMFDGEIDDWDVFENDIRNKANKVLGNDFE